MKVKALFLSDVHLGSRGCNSEALLEVLKKYTPENLFLIGDIIDGWQLRRSYYWNQSYTNLVRKILSYSKNGTNVYYVTGNHDDFLREYGVLDLGNIKIVDEFIYDGLFITHGDLYDGVVKLRWLAKLGSVGYDFAIMTDRFLKKLGFKYSLSKYLKLKVKEAVKFITDYENELVRQAKSRGCRGVVCGHIHKEEYKFIDDTLYINCGDWVENCSYVVQYMDGTLELKHFIR